MDFQERTLWLENMQLKLQINGSGIKWYAVNVEILCRASDEELDAVPKMRNFREIDQVVPYSLIFKSSKDKCMVSLFDDTNTS